MAGTSPAMTEETYRRSRVFIPFLDIPQIAVPAADPRLQFVVEGLDGRPGNDRNDGVVAASKIVDLDEVRRAFYRVELALGRLVGGVGFRVGPADDVAALPFVLLGGDLPRNKLQQKRFRIRLRHGLREHLHV